VSDARHGLGTGAALLAFLAAALVLAACDPGPASRPTSASAQAQGRTAAAASTVPASSGRSGAVPRPTLVLDPNGFDLARFGDPPPGVVTALTRRLGKPDADTGWRRTLGLPGPCLGGEPQRLRAVRWGGLRVFFSDGATEYAPKGTLHFSGYWLEEAARVGRVRIATAAGITIGSTVAQIKAAYGARGWCWTRTSPMAARALRCGRADGGALLVACRRWPMPAGSAGSRSALSAPIDARTSVTAMPQEGLLCRGRA
jgi:hypothetical protein